jgi:hypothetical protein
MNFCPKCGFPSAQNLNLCNSCMIDLWVEAERMLQAAALYKFQVQLEQPDEEIWAELTK